MNSVEMLSKKQWYEDPNLFSFAMQSEQARKDETYRRDALAQQKSIAERQASLQEKQFNVSSGIQGLTTKVGMWQAKQPIKADMQRFLIDNPLLTKPDEQLTFLEKKKKHEELIPRYMEMLDTQKAYENLTIELSDAIESLLGTK